MKSQLNIFRSRPVFIVFLGLMFTGLFILNNELAVTRLDKAVWNIGHFVSFFFLWLFIVYQFDKFQPDSISGIIKIVVVTLLASALIEVIQYYTGRDASFGDIGLNLAGTLLSLIVIMQLRQYQRRKSYYLYIVFILIIGILVWPIVRIITDEIQRRYEFPLLADFSSSNELDRWYGENTRLKILKTDIGNVLDVTLLPGHKYSVVVLEAFPADWEQYRELDLVIMNKEKEPLTLTMRVHDSSHNDQYSDRYNKKREIPVGLSTISVKLLDLYNAPKGRKMDLENIRAVALFAMNLKIPRHFQIKKVYLR